MFEHFAFGTPALRDDEASIGSDVSPHNTSYPSPRSPRSPPPPEVTAGPSTAPHSCVVDLASAHGLDDISASYLPSPTSNFHHDLEVDEDCQDYDEMFLSIDDNECGDGEDTKSKGKAKPQTGKDCNVSPAPTTLAYPTASSSCHPTTSPLQPTHTSPTPLLPAVAAAPTSTPQPTQAGPPEPLPLPDDEGYCEGGDPGDDEGLALTEQILFSLRRASTPMGVTKFSGPSAARIHMQGLATNSTANGMVMCLPRMRRKIKTRRKRANGAV